jgi:N-acetylmuramoyl-L-alanine amidase
LSNPREEALLKSDAYQVKIALAVLSGYLNYQKGC